MEAAKKIRVSKQTIHDAIAAKRLKATKHNIKATIVKKMRVTMIAESDLKAFQKTISKSHQERAKKSELAGQTESS